MINKRWEFKSFCTDKDFVSEQVRDLCEQGYNRIIVSGGDGTIREVINGIMVSKRDPIVGEDFTDFLGSLKKLTINTAGRIRFFL